MSSRVLIEEWGVLKGPLRPCCLATMLHAKPPSIRDLLPLIPTQLTWPSATTINSTFER